MLYRKVIAFPVHCKHRSLHLLGTVMAKHIRSVPHLLPHISADINRGLPVPKVVELFFRIAQADISLRGDLWPRPTRVHPRLHRPMATLLVR